jgi:hypothetical protein
MPLSKRQEEGVLGGRKGMDKTALYIVDGNRDWSSHYRKQYGDSSRN